MNKYNLWIEGFMATGSQGVARLVAEDIEGETFKDAVIAYMSKVEDRLKFFNPDKMTFWGCCLHESHEAAAKSFG